MAHESVAPDYHAEAIRCHSCREREAELARFAGKDHKPSPTAGLYVAVTKNGMD